MDTYFDFSAAWINFRCPPNEKIWLQACMYKQLDQSSSDTFAILVRNSVDVTKTVMHYTKNVPTHLKAYLSKCSYSSPKLT